MGTRNVPPPLIGSSMVLKLKPRKVIEQPEEDKKVGLYFTKVHKGLEMFSSGCQLLDCVLGGGWPLGRVSNVVGDKSSGKTLLAIEACSNFNRQYPSGAIHYFETEAAFDKNYAEALGMPVDKITFPDIAMDDSTVEALFEYLNTQVQHHIKSKEPAIIIVDSLDALSDRTELNNPIDKGTYGATKPKQLSQLFRRLINPLKTTRIHVMIISQVRDNIGVTFGSKHTRSGGRALDFYASQTLWLAEKGKKDRTIRGIKRIIGVDVLANCKKNKVGLPFRSCEFPIYFGYGVDDLEANLAFLNSYEALDLLPDIFETPKLTQAEFTNRLKRLRDTAVGQEEWNALREEVAEKVVKVWEEVEAQFMPTHTKY